MLPLAELVRGNVPLGLAAAALWGGGDFTGGMGVRTVGGSMRGTVRIVLLSHLTSLVVLLGFAITAGGTAPRGALLAWGLAAGLTGSVSIMAFYIALSRGAMGGAAAVSGLLAAAIPAGVSLALEGSPGWMRLAGFAVAGVAIWMIAAGPEVAGAAKDRTATVLAVLAGAGFGLYFVELRMASPVGAVWALTTARTASVCLCSVLVVALGRGAEEPIRVTWRAGRWVLLTALLDTSGNLFFAMAARAGRLDIAAVLASLYPATTILLAAWTLHERPTRRQGLGMVVAVAAVVLITL